MKVQIEGASHEVEGERESTEHFNKIFWGDHRPVLLTIGRERESIKPFHVALYISNLEKYNVPLGKGSFCESEVVQL